MQHFRLHKHINSFFKNRVLFPICGIFTAYFPTPMHVKLKDKIKMNTSPACVDTHSKHLKPKYFDIKSTLGPIK